MVTKHIASSGKTFMAAFVVTAFFLIGLIISNEKVECLSRAKLLEMMVKMFAERCVSFLECLLIKE